MSRGHGAVQRTIIEIFKTTPQIKLTVEEIARIVYSEALISRSQRESVRRAMQSVMPVLNLRKCRNRLPDAFGWQHVYGR